MNSQINLKDKVNTATSYLEHMCALDIDSKTKFVRLSGIVCTIGECTDIIYYTTYTVQYILYYINLDVSM